MSIDVVVKIGLAAFAIVYVGIVYLWRIFAVWRKTGIWPVTYGGAPTTHDLVGKAFAVLVGLSISGTVIYVASPVWYEYLFPVRMLEAVVLQVIGLVFAWLSMFWTILAQHQMGAAWRIGIDTHHPTPFIQHGLFRLSRHPIYLGVTTTSASLFLIMPNLLTLSVLVATAISLSVQARLEEEHLERAHGNAFVDFVRRTHRWL